ncbi:MAG: hypothetical protein PHV90_01515 [Smithella sp.]|jgi:hypothetical protein|nr:hypothetical protein [Smithella sp.]
MIVKILGAESLGVRGLFCVVELKNRKICIDPGIALGWSRQGFLPHPFQIAVGADIRENIIDELKDATDVIISHFDGDHCPLLHPNPFQLGIEEVKDSLSQCRIWAKGPDQCPSTQKKRREELAESLNRELFNAEGMREHHLEFSAPVPHGQQEEHRIMMSRIEENGETFVHASDIQLLNENTIETILKWKPDIVFVSGPPLYRYVLPSHQVQREHAWENAIRLSEQIDTLIIDHHLLRSEEGIAWLGKLKRAARHKIYCAADFMERTPLFLEAWRKALYEWLPVSEDWHENYQHGKIDVRDYRIRGWDVLISRGKIKPCKWYDACPMKAYTKQGKLERYWIENYCLVDNHRHCLRYQMEEQGQYHPDFMLPNGETRKDLQ